MAKSLAKLQKQCDEWNAAHPVGTAVICNKDFVGDVPTKTRSEAYVLSGHSPVIFLEGISGCYHLSHVRPAPAHRESQS
jgi:hypothetical protein